MRRSIRRRSKRRRSGNFNAGQFTKQLHLGAFIPEIDPKLHGIPTMHTEAACASGSLSVLLGAQWVMGGFHDAVLVVGAEQQKTMSSLDGSDVLGAAADYHVEKPEYGDFMFPKLFGRIAQIYIEKYGASPDDLASVAYKNYAHARLNPLAQMREADLTYERRVAGLRQESERRAAAPGFGLLADHRRQRGADPRFGKVSRSNRPRQIQARPAARVRSARPIISRSRKRTRRRFRPRAKRPRKPSAWRT